MSWHADQGLTPRDYPRCSAEGCWTVTHARNLCSKHYQRMSRNGHVDLLRDAERSVYCDCAPPVVGWWGLECSACRRLIEGSIARGLGRG